MCFVGFSFQIELVAVAGSVALFTHCQAVQLSAMTDFVVLNRRTKARIKNCKFLARRTKQNNFFFLLSSHTCTIDNTYCRYVLSMHVRVNS